MDDSLTRNQKRVLAALLSEPTAKAVVAACELAARTIYGYLMDPDFREALRKRQGEMLAQTGGRS